MNTFGTQIDEHEAQPAHVQYAIQLFNDVSIAQEALVLLKALKPESLPRDNKGKLIKVAKDYKRWTDLSEFQFNKLHKLWIQLGEHEKSLILSTAKENTKKMFLLVSQRRTLPRQRNMIK